MLRLVLRQRFQGVNVCCVRIIEQITPEMFDGCHSVRNVSRKIRLEHSRSKYDRMSFITRNHFVIKVVAPDKYSESQNQYQNRVVIVPPEEAGLIVHGIDFPGRVYAACEKITIFEV